MSHVTTDELAACERQMLVLCEARRQVIADAEAAVKTANRDFDRQAKHLGQRINQLRTELAPKPERKQAARSVAMDGLTPEEQQHYHELLQRKNGKS